MKKLGFGCMCFPMQGQQLDRLGTDYVDYYWLHAVNGELYEKIQSLKLVGGMLET